MKIILDEPDLSLVGLNDLISSDNLAYLLKYDTLHGHYRKDISAEGESLIIDGCGYKLFSEKDPASLPWGELGVDVVFECTGIFRHRNDLQKHLDAGAKQVILSAPPKDDVPMVVYGVNSVAEAGNILSCASCTTNCISPIIEVIGRHIGIQKAVMTTVHAYTSSQGIVDGPSQKLRRGRAGAANLVPTSTGAAKATTRVLPQYDGKFDGVAARVPIPCGSIADIVILAGRETSVDEINEVLSEEAESDRYKGILGVTDEQLVSSDIVGDTRASVVDLSMTQVIDQDLIKVMSWYDNEWGYTSQMVRTALNKAENVN
jgi:glyceraldehyde 3-phosphate dehydrogenase